MRQSKFKDTSFLIFTFCLLLVGDVVAQTNKSLRETFDNIKTVPSSYVSFKKGSNYKDVGEIDSNYQKILLQDSLVIPFLVEQLTDTTKTSVFSACTNTMLAKGDIALFILHNINHTIIDYSTDSEWDVLGNCGRFPYGFFEYFQKHRSKFQSNCNQTVNVFYPTLRQLKCNQ